VADLLTTLDGYDVTLVEVRCAPEELDRRERVRADRTIGLARSQTSVYRIGEFDIVVDTTRSSADECATAIIHAFGVLPLVKAFDRLRARRDS
jgi:chloramphenicol 3-O phosphotransferase